MPWLPQRAVESAEGDVAAMVAAGASYTGLIDPIDGDRGFRRIGEGRNELPGWSLERARARSLFMWRANPMGRAIVDTYTSFCVGDAGVALQCSSPEVQVVAQEFWEDPANDLEASQELLLRSHMIDGETALEMMVGPVTGVTQMSYIDPYAISGVDLARQNPMWLGTLRLRTTGGETSREIVRLDQLQRVRRGEVMFWPDWRARMSDRRGTPFLTPILDWLDSYDRVLSNLIDRTALARYLVWDVTVDGGSKEIDDFIKTRGGTAAPRSGTIEVHNDKVKWEPKGAQSGSFEDTATAQSVLTEVAAGAGLAKTWLAEPEDANRATSLTMAEPVRRRVGGVQRAWLAHQTELVRFAVDQAVIAGRLPRSVTVRRGEQDVDVPPAQTVRITGPEIAAADAQVNAQVLVHLSAALTGLQAAGILSDGAAKRAAEVAWENFVGIPYTPDLDDPDGGRADDLAEQIDNADPRRTAALGLVG